MTISGHASPEAIQAVAVAFTVIALLVIIARLLTRTLISKQAGLDDAFIGIAGIFALAMCITTYLQASYGMGKHAYEFSAEYFEKVCLYFWAATWTYYAALAFTKMSILMQYLRIFPQPWFRKACYTMIVVNVAWSLWAIFSSIFMCVPVPMFWKEVAFVTPYCLNRLTVWYADAAINIVTDCVVAFLPLPIINSLEVPRRQKHLLLGVFGIGFLTCIISVLRLAYIYPVSVSSDMTWESPLICIWSEVESCTGILCSCAPTLKGGIQRVWPKFLESMASRRAGSSSRGSSKFSILMGKREKGSGYSSERSGSSSDEEAGLATQLSQCSEKPVKSQPALNRLGFRRSFFSSPFTSLSRPGHFDSTTSRSNPVYFTSAHHHPNNTSSSASLPIATDIKTGSTQLSNLAEDERQIEVRTVVDQVSEIRANSPMEPVEGKPVGVRQPPSLTTLAQGAVKDGRGSRAESTRTVVSGGGVVRAVGGDDKEVERLAWV